jgi:hypothetical protein
MCLEVKYKHNQPGFEKEKVKSTLACRTCKYVRLFRAAAVAAVAAATESFAV